MYLRRFHAAALSLVLVPPSFGQSVLVVDDDGGPGVFTEVHEAVDAASPGDVVLVESGIYDPVFVGKPLSIVADEGADVLIERINVSSGMDGDLVLSGLDVWTNFVSAINMSDVPGSVWIEDCDLRGGIGVGGVGSGFGASMIGCASVTFENSSLWGGYDALNDPAAGAVVLNSTVFFFGSFVRGNDGLAGMSIFQPPQDGSIGMSVVGSFVFCQDSSIVGGDGGDSGPFCMGADGGDGVVLTGSELRLLDATAVGGSGGTSQAACSPGSAGVPVNVGTSTLLQLPGTARSFTVQRVVREQETVLFVVEGQPGDAVFAGYSLAQAALFLPGFDAPSLIEPPPAARVLFLGTIPATGTLAFSLPIGNLSPGASALRLQTQIAVRDANGFALGNGRSITLVDGAF